MSQATAATDDLKDAIEENNVEDTLNELLDDATQIDLGIDGGASVPEGFPGGLPLPSGDLALALADAGTWNLEPGTWNLEPGTWNLSYAVSDAFEADKLAAWLEGRSEYMAQEEIDTPGMHVWAFIGPQYYVNVALLTSADDTMQLVYGVTEGLE